MGYRLTCALLIGVLYVLIPVLFRGAVCVFIHFPFGRNKDAIQEPAAVYHWNTEYHNPLNSNASLPSRERALFKKLFVILQARVLCYYVTPSRSKSESLESLNTVRVREFDPALCALSLYWCY